MQFKVTRPKYYLIKLDHGFCDAKTSVTISIMLHQEVKVFGFRELMKVKVIRLSSISN
jgi:hypothetical protein